MKRRYWVFPLLLLLVFPIFSFWDGAVFGSIDSVRTLDVVGDRGGRPLFVEGEVLVKFISRASDNEVAALKASQGVEELGVSVFSGVRRWKVPASRTVEEWVSFFDRHPLVEYAKPNFVRAAFWVPDDPFYVYQWSFDDDHTLNPGGGSVNPYGGANAGGILLEEVLESKFSFDLLDSVNQEHKMLIVRSKIDIVSQRIIKF